MTTTPELPLLLEPAELAAHLDEPGLLLVDVSAPESYAEGHLPGAINLPPLALMHGQPPAPGLLPEPGRLEKLFRSIGLTEETHVVAHDDEGGGWAARLLWTLDMIGHPHYSLLNGGRPAWQHDGRELVTDPVSPSASHYQLGDIRAEPRASTEEILAHLEDPDWAVWDARSPAEFDGIKSGSSRAGHIPGAANLDWLQLMDRSRGLRLRPLDAIQAELDALGLTRDKCIVTHCQSHHRSALTYITARILGYPRVKGYDGSWAEWGNRDDTPIAS